MVYRTAESTSGLRNVAIERLEDAHVIRAEWRAGARWYELTHDRLIEPIRSANRRAEVARRKRFLLLTGSVLGALAILVVIGTIVAVRGGTVAANLPPRTPPCTRLPSPVGRSAATSVAFSFGGGLTLVSGYSSGTAQVWDVASCLTVAALHSHVSGAVYSVAYSPLGALATGGANGAVFIWNLATNQVAVTLSVGGPVQTVAFSPDGRVLAAGGDFGVRLFNASTHRVVGSPLPTGAGATSVAFSPDGRLLAIAGTSGIALVDVAAHVLINRLPTRTPALTVAFSPNGETLAVGTEGGAVHVLDTTNAIRRAPTRSIPSPIWQAHAKITSVAYSPNGTLAAASADGVVQTFDKTRRILSFQIAGVPTGIAFSPNATRLAVASSLGDISIRPQ